MTTIGTQQGELKAVLDETLAGLLSKCAQCFTSDDGCSGKPCDTYRALNELYERRRSPAADKVAKRCDCDLYEHEDGTIRCTKCSRIRHRGEPPGAMIPPEALCLQCEQHHDSLECPPRAAKPEAPLDRAIAERDDLLREWLANDESWTSDERDSFIRRVLAVLSGSAP